VRVTIECCLESRGYTVFILVDLLITQSAIPYSMNFHRHKIRVAVVNVNFNHLM